MTIFTTMLIMGAILGFVGAGGSGFIIAILITFFDVPIHTALATAMAAMFLTMITGSISHFKEGNMDVRTGLMIGVFGAVGSYLGTIVAHYLPEGILVGLTGGMLLLSSYLIWHRTRMKFNPDPKALSHTGWRALGVGLITGGMSGTFGIGSTPFIQLSLITVMHKSLRVVAGTTMLIILPIAFFGAVGYNQAGYLDVGLLLKVVSGTMLGSYLGAKFTNKAPVPVLRMAMIITPLLSGLLIIRQSFL